MNAQTKDPLAPDPLAPLLDALAVRLAPMIVAAMAPPAPPANDGDEIWNAAQVADHLGISPRTMPARRKLAGFPPPVPRAGRPRWRASDIRAYALGTYRPAN